MPDPASRPDGLGCLSFLTNHARVLAGLAADPAATLRAVAARVGVTDRAVQRIVAGLAAAGYFSASRAGRRNRYTINRKARLGHPLEAHRTAGDVIDLAAAPAS